MAGQMKSICVDPWQLIASKVTRAVVFIDNASAECLHWSGGVTRFFEQGALDIKELSSFESGDPAHKKAVFITSSLLFDTTASIIEDVIGASDFQYVIVITNQSSHQHLYARTGSVDGDDKEVFFQFEEKVLEWMGNMNFTSEVHHVPFSAACVTPDLFVLPSFGHVFPFLPGDNKRIEFQLNKGKIASGERKKLESLADVEFNQLPEAVRVQYMGIVSALNDLMNQLKVCDDCYAVGHTSRMLATELANYAPARGRRKAATDKASILFVDRTLDLAGPCSHLGENVVDKIRHLLPELPHHKNDVCVNMVNLCSVISDDSQHDVIVPGCLAQVEASKSADLLNQLVHCKQKEALMEVNKRLVEAAMKENLPLKMSGKPGRITADQLESHVKLFKGNSTAIQKHSGLLQISNSIIQMLRHSQFARHDAMMSIEKLLLQNIWDEDCPSAASQISLLLDRELKKPKHEREVSIEEVLHLLVFSYGLVEDATYSTKEEDELKELLTNAVTAEEVLPDTLETIFADPGNRDNVMATWGTIFSRLRALSQVRKDLKKFRQIYDAGGVTSPACYRPLLQQIVEEIFNSSKPELVDVEYKSGKLKDLLKTGFGYFMSVSKPRPNDHPLLIVFIVGGVTSNEVKQIQETLAKYQSNTKIVVGSTCLVKPKDLVDTIFTRDPLEPGLV
ncbi:sec1 family domain-containing protein 2-like [Lineus longissimus]|uniref:sec1 family domain-containing protein 2-like n=1 Tax=Lineus longissimus TaxID=88925 RepID=UPI002B4D4BC1